MYRALLTSELQSIFANAPKAPTALANTKVRDAYARATGNASTSTSSDSKKRIPGPEDSCPICYEDMHGISQDKLVFCEECGNALHTECFAQCSVLGCLSLPAKADSSFCVLFAGRRRTPQLTCVWCRAKWPVGVKDGAGAKPTSEGYVNLGGVAGLSGERDTSSCTW